MDVNMQKFDLVVPAGSFCVTGYHLRKAGLHGETLPFDWLENVTLELFAGFLENGFEDFLAQDQLMPDFEGKSGKGHYRFRMPNGMTFVHDFAYDHPGADFAAVRQKYDRRIKRLFDRMEKARSILFVHCSRFEADPHALNRLCGRLKECCPGKSIKLLYVHLVNGKRGFDYLVQLPDMDVVEMEFGTNSDPKQFWIGKVSVFNRMLSAYRLTFAARFRLWLNKQKRKFCKSYDRM